MGDVAGVVGVVAAAVAEAAADVEGKQQQQR